MADVIGGHEIIGAEKERSLSCVMLSAIEYKTQVWIFIIRTHSCKFVAKNRNQFFVDK